ncbi:MAG: hypothetical protein ABSF62_19160 [Bryobacteraceae bacterium]|jgi:hypothetical protein
MFARRPKSAQAMARRARIVLSCGQGIVRIWRAFGLQPHRVEQRNESPKPFVWTADADLILG